MIYLWIGIAFCKPIEKASSGTSSTNQETMSVRITMDPVSRIKQLMHESCGRARSIEHFCEQAEIPYHTLRKSFHRIEGISLSEYWQQCRLQKAEELLAKPDTYVFEVAYAMGFSEGNFTAWFKKRKGMTPTEYQQRGRRH